MSTPEMRQRYAVRNLEHTYTFSYCASCFTALCSPTAARGRLRSCGPTSHPRFRHVPCGVEQRASYRFRLVRCWHWQRDRLRSHLCGLTACYREFRRCPGLGGLHAHRPALCRYRHSRIRNRRLPKLATVASSTGRRAVAHCNTRAVIGC
jgi:hypothetical protein